MWIACKQHACSQCDCHQYSNNWLCHVQAVRQLLVTDMPIVLSRGITGQAGPCSPACMSHCHHSLWEREREYHPPPPAGGWSWTILLCRAHLSCAPAALEQTCSGRLSRSITGLLDPTQGQPQHVCRAFAGMAAHATQNCRSFSKIAVANPVVDVDGDEMTRRVLAAHSHFVSDRSELNSVIWWVCRVIWDEIKKKVCLTSQVAELAAVQV